MQKTKSIICVMMVVYCFGLSEGDATLIFDDGYVHTIDWTIEEGIDIRNNAWNEPTTINFVAGGSVEYVAVRNSSKFNMSGGSIMGYLDAYNNSQIVISGGSIQSWLYAPNFAQVTILGGSIGFLETGQSSQVTISGGSIIGELIADDGSIITIEGIDFSIDGIPTAYGEITSLLGGSAQNEPARHLTGTLASGDLLDNDFYIGDNASIVLIPEPSTFLLLGLGAFILRRKR